MRVPVRFHSVLDDENAAFVQRRVSLIVAGRSEANVPSVVRALGCKVAADRCRVGAFVPRAAAAELLRDVAANGQVALVATRPSTFRTIQLKGYDGTIEPLAPGDADTVRAYADSFVEDVGTLGYSEALMRAVVRADPADLVVVSFTPTDAFMQTPGPGAGRRIEAAQ